MDPDPVQSRLKTMEFHADLWLPVQAAAFAKAVYEAATGMLSKSDMDRMADRRAKLETRKRQIAEDEEAKAMALATRSPIHPRWVAHEVGSVLERDTIMLDDSVSAIKALFEANEGGIASSDPALIAIREKLIDTLARFDSAEDALWTQLDAR